MRESLAAACGQFEQSILAQMLQTAFGSVNARCQENVDDDVGSTAGASQNAFSQLIAQALASAIERAGGIGLRQTLLHALAREHRS